jgi:hypothetical protein
MSNVLTWGTAVLLALALAVVLRFRRRVRAYRVSLEKIVQGILLLRRMAGRSPRLVPLPDDSPDRVPLDRAEPDLETADLHVVGDVHELGENGKPAAAMRWFVSGDGTVFGWLGVSPAGPVMHEPLRWDEGLDATLERHRAAVERMGAPLAVDGLEGSLGGMDALKAHVGEWRAAQDPAALLEADVRKILGDRFRDLGETVVRLVRLAEASGQGRGRTVAARRPIP